MRDKVFGPEKVQRLDRCASAEQAIRSVTANAAWQ